MSSHRLALVPLEAWSYNAPDVAVTGRKVDVGLLCEALLYYDEVALSVGNQQQFTELLGWFQERGCLDELLALFHEEALLVYEGANEAASQPVRGWSGVFGMPVQSSPEPPIG